MPADALMPKATATAASVRSGAASASFLLVMISSLTGVRPDYRTARGSLLHGRADRLLDAPGEVDPEVRAPPYVLTGDARAGLLIEHRDPRLCDLADAKVLHEGERRARVGDVVDDQHPGLAEVDEVGDGRQDHRDVEPLVDAGVELDVHRVRVLHVEGVGQRARDEQAAAGDAEHEVGAPAVRMDRLREVARARPELVPGHRLADPAHRTILTSVAAAA